MIGESVTLRRAVAATANRYGDATVTYTDIPLTAVVWPRTSSESDQPGRTQITDGLTASIPTGTVIDPRLDRFVVRGNTYEVDGEPGDYRSPWTDLRALIVNLSRVKG